MAEESNGVGLEAGAGGPGGCPGTKESRDERLVGSIRGKGRGDVMGDSRDGGVVGVGIEPADLLGEVSDDFVPGEGKQT